MTSRRRPSGPKQVEVFPDVPWTPFWGPQDLGQVIAVLLPLADRESWVALVVDAVQNTASAVHPLVLCDAGFDEPCMSALAKDAPPEGLADALFHGTSAARIRRDGSGGEGRWFQVGTGFPLPSPDAGWYHPDWTVVLEGLTPPQGTLLLLLPSEFAGARALARKFPRQVELVRGKGGRAGRSFFVLAALLGFLTLVGLAWLLGWLQRLGLPAPESLPSGVEDLLRRLGAEREPR
jgi:hypothetical protein